VKLSKKERNLKLQFWLKAGLKKPGKTQKALSDFCKMNKQNINRWYKTGAIPIDHIISIAKYLGTSIEPWMIGGDDENGDWDLSIFSGLNNRDSFSMFHEESTLAEIKVMADVLVAVERLEDDAKSRFITWMHHKYPIQNN
jgi:hypothetical protein